mmetsp:Transcript_19020/g.40466  ORF Transcript_19020/g.40466 Transcript_19020/m.40466 type:complete len:89 (+) Transcript_19020:854-1120(+)
MGTKRSVMSKGERRADVQTFTMVVGSIAETVLEPLVSASAGAPACGTSMVVDFPLDILPWRIYGGSPLCSCSGVHGTTGCRTGLCGTV